MLLRKNTRNIVLPFFAGISKLDNHAVYEILIKAVLDPAKFLSSDLPDLTELRFDVAVSQRLFLLLLNCIYESESIDLCLDTAEEIASNSINNTTSLMFNGTVLDPSDYIAIGYFLTHLSHHTISLPELVQYSGHRSGTAIQKTVWKERRQICASTSTRGEF